MSMTVGDVARSLGVSCNAVRNWIDEGLVKGAQKLPNTRWLLPDDVIEQLTSKNVLIVFDTQMFRWFARDFAVYKKYNIVGYVNTKELNDINELKSIIKEKCANAIISKDTLDVDLDDSITRFTF